MCYCSNSRIFVYLRNEVRLVWGLISTDSKAHSFVFEMFVVAVRLVCAARGIVHLFEKVDLLALTDG